MKIRTRITAAVTAALATLMVATPAFATGGDESASIFDHSGGQLNFVAITIVMVVLAAIVLGLAGWVSGLFKK